MRPSRIPRRWTITTDRWCRRIRRSGRDTLGGGHRLHTSSVELTRLSWSVTTPDVAADAGETHIYEPAGGGPGFGIGGASLG